MKSSLFLSPSSMLGNEISLSLMASCALIPLLRIGIGQYPPSTTRSTI